MRCYLGDGVKSSHRKLLKDSFRPAEDKLRDENSHSYKVYLQYQFLDVSPVGASFVKKVGKTYFYNRAVEAKQYCDRKTEEWINSEDRLRRERETWEHIMSKGGPTMKASP